MRARVHLAGFIFAVWMMQSSSVTAEVDPKLLAELNSTIEEFSARHYLTAAEKQALVGEVLLETKMRKGGVGIVNSDVYAVLDEGVNKLQVGGTNWEGRSSSDNEVVIIAGSRIMDPNLATTFENPIVVFFTPAEVRFIDLSNGTGGKYLRFKN